MATQHTIHGLNSRSMHAYTTFRGVSEEDFDEKLNKFNVTSEVETEYKRYETLTTLISKTLTVSDDYIYLNYDWFRRRRFAMEITLPKLSEVIDHCQEFLRTHATDYACLFSIFRNSTFDGDAYIGRMLLTVNSCTCEKMVLSEWRPYWQ